MSEDIIPAFKEMAPRIVGLREALGLSLSELAARIGVTEEKLALYESGTVEIPVSFMMDLGQLSGVDLTDLISGGQAHLQDYTLVRKGDGLSVDRRKDYSYESLAARLTGRRMEPFLVRVPPKDEKDMNFTTHKGQEFIYVLEGCLELRLDKKVLVMEVGDSLYFRSRIPHALRALGGKEAVFVDVLG